MGGAAVSEGVQVVTAPKHRHQPAAGIVACHRQAELGEAGVIGSLQAEVARRIVTVSIEAGGHLHELGAEAIGSRMQALRKDRQHQITT